MRDQSKLDFASIFDLTQPAGKQLTTSGDL